MPIVRDSVKLVAFFFLNWVASLPHISSPEVVYEVYSIASATNLKHVVSILFKEW